MVRFAPFACLIFGLIACEDPPCDDMNASSAGLVVTASEHQEGWGDPSCESCHLLGALHRRGCTPGVNLQLLRDNLDTSTDPSAECAACHGDMGVAQ